MGLGKVILFLVFLVGLAAVLIPFFTPELQPPKPEDGWFGKKKLKSKL